MVDSGSEVNLLKQNAIKDKKTIDSTNTLSLQGISSTPLKTLGSITIPLIGQLVEFHAISDDFPFPQDGILGTAFLEQTGATINYRENHVRFDNVYVPFHKNETILLKPRMVTPFFVTITNPEVQSGYIPPLTSAEGVHLGDALVTNSYGKAHLPIFNTTDKSCELEIPPVELLKYSVVISPGNSNLNPDAPCFSVNSRGHAADDPSPSTNLTTFTNFAESTNFTEFANFAESTNFTESTNFAEFANFAESINSSPTTSRGDIIYDLLRLDHLGAEERISVKGLIDEYSDRFYIPGDSLPMTNTTQHTILTTDNIPIHTKQYRYPPAHKTEINKQINELLNNGIIEHSKSPYNSPVWIVPKKPDSLGNKRWRLVIDYRALNEKTINDAYPLPNISEILDQLGGAKYFSILDLASGFHQIPMATQDAPKTGFSSSFGHYQFKRMPFGLKNAPATFQRLMDTVLSGLQGNELFVYMDDIVVYAHSLHEHDIKLKRLM